MKRGPVQKTAALALSAGLLLTLSACGSPAPSQANACDVPSGNSSKAVVATGSVGSEPEDVSFPTPIVASRTEVTTIKAGKGEPIGLETPVLINFAVYNGATGQAINPYSPVSVSQSTGQPQIVTLSALSALPGFQDAMQCATEGSRVAVALPAKEGFGAEGNAQLGLGKDDTLVFVADVVHTYPTRATGDPQPAQNGFPSVVTDPDGVPGITIPKSDPPKKYKETLLRKGSGAKVAKGDTVTLNYTGVLWDTGDVFDSSWQNGTPVQFPAQEGSADRPGVVKGFADALIGARVGDQVLAVLPPDVAYGKQGSGAIPANATLVFVIDVLGVDKAKG
jgi:FKBP-type peptidyl-prolyl cis-trans isomerase